MVNCRLIIEDGELAQLARAPALHAGGHRFDSDILHNKFNYELGIRIEEGTGIKEGIKLRASGPKV